MTTAHELETLLNDLRPKTIVDMLPAAELPAPQAIYKAEALRMLERYPEAHACLEAALPALEGDDLAYGLRLWAELQLQTGQYDAAILSAERAAAVAQHHDLRAAALAWSAIGYARKRCPKLAQTALKEAFAQAQALPLVLLAQARTLLTLDQRIEARAVYERMAAHGSRWARAHGLWGQGSVALLLGAFDEARRLAEEALDCSTEIVGPLGVLGYTALAQNDVAALQDIIGRVEERSPEALGLELWRRELERLQVRLAEDGGARKRLSAFPTLVQRRDYCGPSTVELVLRYWNASLELNNDQIAQVVKFPGGGTPTYKMREFFHLAGFDTLRCRADCDQLKSLVDAGYPVIVEEEFSNSAHVSVVIGYDDVAQAVEFQDPATHVVTIIPREEVDKLRRRSFNAALIAFPAGQGHDKELARRGFFDDEALVLVDQAALAIDGEKLESAVELAGRAVQKQPGYELGWMLLLQARLEQWRGARHTLGASSSGLAAKLQRDRGATATAAREQFYADLARAQGHHADGLFPSLYEGIGALLDRDMARALGRFERARELDPESARTLALLAECHYALRALEQAGEAARQALGCDPALHTANVWTARVLAAQGEETALHYARCGAELAPDWWLAHQALAEAELVVGDYGAARRELSSALSLAPAQPEPHLQIGMLMAAGGEAAEAVAELDKALNGPLQPTPMTAYGARRTLCRIFYSSELFEDALEQAAPLLELFPDDAWALQFVGAARANMLLQAGRQPDEPELAEIQALYERSLEQGADPSTIGRGYLHYLTRLAGAPEAEQTARQLRERYPESGALAFLHGQLLSQLGQQEPAARAMVEALGRADGIADSEQLYEAAGAIIEGLGPETGAQLVLETAPAEGGVPRADRERMLGLLLAVVEGQEERARELLTSALAREPEDAFATLRLGEIAESEEQREAYFRRALLLAPEWPHARSRLAHHLVSADRPREALEFTSGYQDESLALLTAHARSLLHVGRFEEAAQAFQQAVERDDEPGEWLFYNAWHAASRAGLHEQALAIAQAAIASHPESGELYAQAARALNKLDRVDEALALLAQGQAHGLDQGDALDLEYEIAFDREDHEGALALAERALGLGLESDDEEGDEAAAARAGRELGRWELRKLQLLLELERTEEARALVEGRELSADGWGRVAWTAMSADSDELCLEFAERSLALDQENFAGLYTRAQALQNLDRLQEAIAAYHALREAHPSEHNAYEKLAVILAVEEQDLGQALALAERAVALGSFCHAAWANRGYVNFVCGQYEQARADLQTAWNRTSPDDRRDMNQDWWLLAALSGDQGQAEHYRQRALDEVETTFGRRQIEQTDAILARLKG